MLVVPKFFLPIFPEKKGLIQRRNSFQFQPCDNPGLLSPLPGPGHVVSSNRRGAPVRGQGRRRDMQPPERPGLHGHVQAVADRREAVSGVQEGDFLRLAVRAHRVALRHGFHQPVEARGVQGDRQQHGEQD